MTKGGIDGSKLTVSLNVTDNQWEQQRGVEKKTVGMKGGDWHAKGNGGKYFLIPFLPLFENVHLYISTSVH